MSKNRFIINHVGYLPHATKHLVYHGNATEFTVYRFLDCRLTPVFTAPLTPFGEDQLDENAKVGDFSNLTEPGIYRLGTSEGKSRCFIVKENAYDTVARTLVYFFNWQRCGDPMGWNGICHEDDRIVLKDGTVRSLAGGHHQSSDLRKWTFGTSLGMTGLLQYALRQKPSWDKQMIEDEIRHSLKYYLALISDEGYIFDSSFTYEGDTGEYINKGYGDYNKPWLRRQYYDRPAPAPSHYQAIQLFSLCTQYFTNIAPDHNMAERCLSAAQKVYHFMKTTKQSPYVLPIYPPLGHGGMEYYYGGFYDSSAMAYAGIALSAIEIYRIAPSEKLYDDACIALRQLIHLQIRNGAAKGCFLESAGSRQLANNYCYFFSTGIPQALINAAELWKSAPDQVLWLEAIEMIAEQYWTASKKNSYNRVPVCYYTQNYHAYRNADFNKGNVFEKQYFAGTSNIDGEAQAIQYGMESYCYNLDIEAMGIFFKKASKLLKRNEYEEIAYSQLDWLLGANRFDASNVNGVGYNVPHRGIYGEFFPPVPQIPGGVYIGYTDECFDEERSGMRNEYDSPMVGWLLYLISELNE